jgi:hypothetical protein
MRGSAACWVIYKIRYFWVIFMIGSSAGVNKRVDVFKERNSQVWNRGEQGDVRGTGFGRGTPVGQDGLAGAGVRWGICQRGGSEPGVGDDPRHAGAGKLIFLLGGGRAWLQVSGHRGGVLL